MNDGIMKRASSIFIKAAFDVLCRVVMDALPACRPPRRSASRATSRPARRRVLVVEKKNVLGWVQVVLFLRMD